MARIFILSSLLLLVACGGPLAVSGPRVVQPGAPGEDNRTLSPRDMAQTLLPQHTEADVRFMQGMLVHHAQALVMTGMVAARTDNQRIHLLARRIELSQYDEIALMRYWLEDRGESLHLEENQGDHADHGDPGGHGGHGLMHGMLSEEELARLAAASGAEFDRLFLEFMIRHHEGAVVMVADLFASPGAGQEEEIFQFASHVEGDQNIEIVRMRGMLSGGR